MIIFRLLIVGLLSILGQVVLLRELAVALYGVELVYLIGIGVWLLGTGLGAMSGPRNFEPREAHVSLLFLLCAILLPLDVAFVRGMRVLLGGVTGAYLRFPQQLFGIALALGPPGMASGLLFRWTAHQYLSGGRSIAAAYAIESAGGMLGGAAATLLLTWGVPNSGGAAVCSVVAVLPLIIPWPHRVPQRGLRLCGITVAAAALAAFALLSPLDRATSAWNHRHVVATGDTPYGRVTVTAMAGQVTIYENDVLSAETDGTSAEEIVHTALLAHAAPKRVLLIGGTAEGMVSAALQHDPERVDRIELNGRLLEIVRPHLPDSVLRPFDDPRVRLIVGDPRRELRKMGPYDVIVLAVSEPSSGQTNRFFTQEFYSEAAQRLVADGVLAFRLRSAENFWSAPLILRNASVIRAVRSALADVIVLPGTSPLVLASAHAIPWTSDVLADRFVARRIRARLVSPDYLHYLYTNDRRRQIEEALAADVPPNTDERPICYYHAAAVWLSRFFPGLLAAGTPAFRNTPPCRIAAGATVLFALLALVFRKIPSLNVRLWLSVAVAGFCGMVVETALLLRFQAANGVLYQDIGLLLTLFMAGLVAGGALFAALARALPGAHTVSAGVMLALTFAVFCAVSGLRVAGGGMTGWIEVGSAMVVCGALVAAVFGYSGAVTSFPVARMVGPFYAADLVGGCAGSLAASLLLIPVVGMVWSLLLCTGLCAAVVLLFHS